MSRRQAHLEAVEKLHAAGLASADLVEHVRLELLHEQYMLAELAEMPYRRGRAEVLARLLEHIEKRHAAGLESAEKVDDMRLGLLHARHDADQLADAPYREARAEIFERRLERIEKQHAAGTVSADQVDDLRLELLREGHEPGESADVIYHQARAQILARRLERLERAHAQGMAGEGELRDTRLKLSEATASATGTWEPYADAWSEHVLWLERQGGQAVAAGSIRLIDARDELREFQRTRPAPPGVSEEAQAAVRRATRIVQGKVSSIEDEGRRILLELESAGYVQAGDELIVARGNQYVATVRVESSDGTTGVAHVIEGMQKLPVAIGDTVQGR